MKGLMEKIPLHVLVNLALVFVHLKKRVGRVNEVNSDELVSQSRFRRACTRGLSLCRRSGKGVAQPVGQSSCEIINLQGLRDRVNPLLG